MDTAAPTNAEYLAIRTGTPRDEALAGERLCEKSKTNNTSRDARNSKNTGEKPSREQEGSTDKRCTDSRIIGVGRLASAVEDSS